MPVTRTVRSFGTPPRAVVFSPPLSLPAPADRAPRTLAIVFQSGMLAILDVTHPDRSEVSVPLAAAGVAVAVPAEVVFGLDEGTAFVRAEGAEDVFAITFAGRAAAPGANDFVPSLNLLPAGRGVGDIALYADAGARKVLCAAAGSGEIAVVDAATANLVRVPVGDPVERILLHPAAAPATALVWSPRGSRVHLARLAGLERGRGANLTAIEAGRPVTDVLAVPGRDRVLLVHGADRAALSVLDLADRTVVPIHGRPLERYAFTGDGAYLLAVAAGTARLGVLDLATLHPVEVRLDDAAGDVLVAGDRVWVDHRSSFGLATLLERAAGAGGPFPRARARILAGFLAEGVLADEPGE